MKIAKILPVLTFALVALGMTSCDDVTEPKYHEPTPGSFTIFTPPLQDQYYKLSDGGTFDLTLSGQPDYGFSAVTQYRAEVSLTEDFAQYETLVPTGTGTLSKMTLKEADLAMAINKLHGVEEASQYVDRGEEKIYFRGAAFIAEIANDADPSINSSYIHTDNVVSLNRVQNFMILPIPGVIYVIGNYVGDWIGPDASNVDALKPYTLSEKDNAIGSKVYYGTIDFQPTDVTQGCIFRFYTALGSWDENSMGCAGGTDSDTPVPFDDFAAGTVLDHALAKTKDSFQFPNYTGVLEFVVDLSDSSNPKATITAPAN